MIISHISTHISSHISTQLLYTLYKLATLFHSVITCQRSYQLSPDERAIRYTIIDAIVITFISIAMAINSAIIAQPESANSWSKLACHQHMIRGKVWVGPYEKNINLLKTEMEACETVLYHHTHIYLSIRSLHSQIISQDTGELTNNI